MTYAGEKLVHKFPLRRETTTDENDPANNGRPNAKGAVDLDARMADMDSEGIDAEIVFPTTGLLSYLVEDRETELASTQIYNDWNDKFLSGHLDRFVRCGILPVRDFDDTVAEMERLAGKGFTAAMLPSLIPEGVPLYNSEAWDKVFDAAQRLDMVLTLHTATGRPDLRPESGPGGAIVNYTDQMRDAIHSRSCTWSRAERWTGFPARKSWWWNRAQAGGRSGRAHGRSGRSARCIRAAQAFDQAQRDHQAPGLCLVPVRPRLHHVALRYRAHRPDLGIGLSAPRRHVPRSREVVGHLFDGIDISEEEKADIVG